MYAVHHEFRHLLAHTFEELFEWYVHPEIPLVNLLTTYCRHGLSGPAVVVRDRLLELVDAREGDGMDQHFAMIIVGGSNVFSVTL